MRCVSILRGSEAEFFFQGAQIAFKFSGTDYPIIDGFGMGIPKSCGTGTKVVAQFLVGGRALEH